MPSGWGRGPVSLKSLPGPGLPRRSLGCWLASILLVACLPAASISLEAGLSLLADGEFASAAEALQQFVLAQPEVPEGYILLALACDASGKHQILAELRERVWDLDLDPQTPTGPMQLVGRAMDQTLKPEPRSRDGRYFAALLHYRLGRFARALQVLHSLAAERPPDWAELNLLGSVYLRLARFEDARASLEQALALADNHADTHYKLGTIHLATEDAGAAVHFLQTAVQFRSNFPAAHAALGMAHLRLRQFPAARSALEKGVSMGPTVQVYLGMAYEKLGEAERALEVYQDAIASAPGFFASHQYRGSLLLKQGRLDEARKHLQKAVDLQPNLPDAHLSLARIQFEQGDRSAALATLERAQDHASDPSADFEHGLGILLGLLGRHEQAREALEQAVRKNPDHIQYLLELATMLQQMGDHAAAAESIEGALERFPDRPELHHLLGFSRYELRQFREALESFETAIQLEPSVAKYHHFLGLCHVALAEDDQAMLAFENAASRDPAHHWAYQQMGLLHLNNSRSEQAEALFMKALEIDPAYAPACFRLGKIYYDRQDNDRALQLLERARALDPDWEDTYFLLGTLYRRRGEPEQAARMFEIFREKKKELQTERRRLYQEKVRKLHQQGPNRSRR